jgi:hypothetical protein
MKAETGVKYTHGQWKTIKHIRTLLQDPEPRVQRNSPNSDSGDSSDSSDSSNLQNQDLDPNVTNALMCLCMLVVMQDTSRTTLYESPIMHYLAVRGVDGKSGTLRSPFFYTGILAGALWINRLLMLEVAIPLEPWPKLGLESKAQVESVRQRIHELRKEHLCEGSFSPTASILSQLARGKAFNKLHFSQPNIHWSEDEQTIYYLGEPVELGRIRNMCHALVQELREAMEGLTFGSNVPSIDLGSAVDSMSWSHAFRRNGYSFTEHVANKERTDVGYQYLFEWAKQGKCKSKGKGGWKLLKKSRASQKMEWVDGQVKKYLSKERQFLRKLMVCMHITGKHLTKVS